MVKFIKIIPLFFLLVIYYNCKGKSMEDKKREEFLKNMTEQLKEGYSSYDEKMKITIKKIIEKNNEITIAKMKIESNILTKDEKIYLDKEYTNYELIYKGKIGNRLIILIGERYKKDIESSLKWGIFFDITDNNFKKIGEFNNNGQFFYIDKDKELHDKRFKYFHIVTFNQNKIQIKSDGYREGFIYAGGFKWWYDEKEKKWKWQMLSPLYE